MVRVVNGLGQDEKRMLYEEKDGKDSQRKGLTESRVEEDLWKGLMVSPKVV